MLRESIWVLLTRLVQRGANLLVFMALARALTTVELGLYGYVVSTALILSVAFDLGLRQGAATMVGQSPERTGAIASHMAPLWILLALLASAAAWAMLAWGGLHEAGTAAMALAVLAIAPMLLVRMGQGMFLGTGDLRHLNQSELVSRGVLLLLTLAAWATGRLDLTMALALIAISQSAAAAFVLVRLWPHLRWRHLPDQALLRELVGRGLGFAGAILLMILSGRIGIWMMMWLQSPAETGSYFAVLRLAEMLVEVATSVGIVVFSHGVRMGDDKAAAAATAAVGRIVAACMACGAVVAGVLAAPLLGLVLGDAYLHAANALRWTLGGAVASCLLMVLYPGLSSRGHATLGVRLFGIAVVVNAMLAVALVPLFAIDGAAAAFAAGQWAAAAATVMAYRRLYGLGWKQLLLPTGSDVANIFHMLGRTRRSSKALTVASG